MNKKGGMGNVIILLFLLLVLVWGLIGFEKTKDDGIECDLGWKSSLCWKWENSTAHMKNTTDKITGYVVDKTPVVTNKLKTIILDN